MVNLLSTGLAPTQTLFVSCSSIVVETHLGCSTHALCHRGDDLLLEPLWQQFTENAINVLQRETFH